MPNDANPRLGTPFWRLFASSTSSNLADGVVRAALPLLAATITRDPVLVSGLATASFLPWLLLYIPSAPKKELSALPYRP